MIRRFVLLVAAAVVTAIVPGTGAAAAQPQNSPSPGNGPAAVSNTTSLPQNFPADLRKYVGGTEEFKSAEWFTGPCQARGGDMGTYLSGMLTNENRLLWWSLPDEGKKALLVGNSAFTATNRANAEAAAEQFVQEGKEPGDEHLPKVFPAGDATYHPPKGVCADDLKGWASASSNTWGFEWVAPDATSVRAAKSARGGDKVPEEAWTKSCASEETGIYCSHAFFVNCQKAGDSGNVDDLQRCRDWNAAVGRLFAGTANWIDQNTSLGDRVGSFLGAVVSKTPVWQEGKWVVSALSGIGDAVIKTVKFIDDPTSIADDWANSIKPAAIDFSTKVLKSLSGSGHFDPGADWFVRQYQVAVAIGFILMAFMSVLAVRRAATRGSTGELAESLFQYLPLSVFLALFAPGFAALLIELTSSLSDSLAEWGGTPTGEMIAHIGEFNTATNASFPGGSLVAIIMFGLLLLGALVMWLGLMLHDYGLPLAGAVSGVSVFLMIHPKYRHKALRPVFLFMGIAFSVPALFFLLSVLFTAANTVYVEGSDDGLGMVAKVFQVGLAMVMVGLAPRALLKWAPILPTAADSEDFGSGSSIIGDTVNSAGNALMFARGGDHGVGAAQPIARVDGADGGGTAGTNANAGSGGGTGDSAGPTGDASNPLTRTYREKGTDGQGTSPAIGTAGAHPGIAATGDKGAADVGAAASGAASGGATIAAAVGIQAVSSAINKAKSEADDTAPRADDDR